jgi:hypothetical protein
MGHINSLTVMSADGASDIVKNATRAMIESTTAIKGLTGLDVPNLIGGAMGRGFGERLRTGDGDGGSDVGSAADRISQIAGEGLSTLKAARAEAEARAKEAEAKVAEDSKKAAAAADKAAAAADAQATAVASRLEASGAVQTTPPATVVQKPGVAPAPWSTVTQAKADAMAGVGPSEGNVAQWGKWMADRLREVPNIQLYDALKLVELGEKGPAPARAVWQTAQAVLLKDYGSVTVGDLLKRFHS